MQRKRANEIEKISFFGIGKNWNDQEDELLLELKSKDKKIQWNKISKIMKEKNFDKTGKQCRERWINYINPDIIKLPLDEAERRKLFQLYHEFGPSWSTISKKFQNRSENILKNTFYQSIRRIIKNLEAFSHDKYKLKISFSETKLKEISEILGLQINEIEVSNFDKIISFYLEQKRSNKKRKKVSRQVCQEMLDKLRTKRNNFSEPQYRVETNEQDLIIKLVKISNSQKSDLLHERSINSDIPKINCSN